MVFKKIVQNSYAIFRADLLVDKKIQWFNYVASSTIYPFNF